MATVVGTLLFEMAANVARLQSDMQKANSVVQGTMQDFRNAAGLAAKALGAIGVVLSVDSFASMIRGSAEALEHMRDLGLKTGNTTEAIAALRPAVKAAGGDLDQMARGMGMLAKNMLTATDTGKGPAKAAFEELGITLVDSTGKLRATADITQEVAEKLTGMEDKTRAAALAKVILGKAGQDLLPVLEEMARLGKQDATGMNEAGEQAHQFLVRLRGLEAQSATLKREFTIGLLPALDSIAAALINSSGKSDTAREAGETFGLVMRTIAQVVYAAWEALNVFGKTIGMVAAALTALATGHPIQAVNILREGIADIQKSAAQAAADIAKMGSAAGALPDKRGGARTADTTRKTSGVGAPSGEDDADYAGEFAAGGTIGAGEWGIVGESGPEVISAGGGSVSVTPLGGRGGFSGLLASASALKKTLLEGKVAGLDLGSALERAGIGGVRRMSDLNGVLRNVLAQLVRAGSTSLIKYLSGKAASALTNASSDYVGDLPIDEAAGAADSSIFESFGGGFAAGGTIQPGMWGIVGEAGPEAVFGGTSGASVVPPGGAGAGDLYVNIHAPGADRTQLAAVLREVRALRASVGGLALGAVQKAFNSRGYKTAFG